MAPPRQSAMSTVIRANRAEAAAEAGTTRGAEGDDLHPSPENSARAAWTLGPSLRCMGKQRERRPPLLELNRGLDTPPEHSLHLASLIGVPSPARVRSMGPQQSSPRDFAWLREQSLGVQLCPTSRRHPRGPGNPGRGTCLRHP